MLIRTFLSGTTQDQLINGGVFAGVLVVGTFLIRSVIKEVTQREKIERLAKDLESANEKLKELDQLKSEFVSLASHQLRGPLTAIKGYTSEIIEGDFGELPKHLEEPVHTIFQSCQSLVVIVEDFLNVSRIDQGRMKYEMTEFDLGELVREVMTENAPTFERKHLRSITDADNGVKVLADRGKVKQIIGNLVDNSLKYTKEGEISVGVKRVGEKVVFSIRDTGVGIRKETMPKLFQKFSRAEDASKANILGTGLGLYVASQMIKAHNGRIWAESAGEGKGSAFFVELKAL
jgi:signal transduction histidine kinase